MKLKAMSAIAAAATTLIAGQAFAASIVLDDFTATQTAVSVAYPGSTASNSIAYGAGTRTLTATQTGSTSAIAGTVLTSSGGALDFSNQAGVTGSASLTYTAVGDINLGANPYFFFDVGYFDNIANFSVSAVDGLGNTSSYSELLGPGFSPFLYFSEFDGSADFNNLATLTFTLDTSLLVTNVDGTLNSISYGADDIAPVPLPAAGFLLLAAVGGMGGIRALSRRKAA